MTIHRTWHTLINIEQYEISTLLFRVCLIFYTYDSANFKASGITPWKKMLSLLLPCYITGYQQTFTVQNKPAAVATGRKPSPIISSFLELGRRKLSMQPKFVCAENVVKTETQQTFAMDLPVLPFSLYSTEVCVLLTIIAWVAHRYVSNSICTAH